MQDGVTDSDPRPKAGGRSPALDRVRLILVALLVLLVVVGVRAGPTMTWSTSWRGPWRDRGDVIAAALELTLASLLVALWVRRRRSPSPGRVAAKLRYALVRVIGIAMLAAAVPFVPNIPQGKIRTRPGQQIPLRRPPAKLPKLKPQPRSPSGTEAAVLKYVLLFLAVLALVAACIFLARRLRGAEENQELVEVEEHDDGSTLRAAVEAGRLALGELTEPRMAIINCYLAMEQSLSLAGAAREGAETPDELLARATGAGLLRGDAPAHLTALFYEARFSTHPVPPSARVQALHALDVISADLQTAIALSADTPADSAAAP